MRINTGNGNYITIWAMIGIWSVSALTSLPGLAISPILGDLTTIFKQATDFEIQMLTSLPSLLIIPFILLAGRMSETIGYIRMLYMGLTIFLLSGILYFLCGTITELILVSVLLGIGAGIITPLSTSLVSRFFVGVERTKQFGYCSAINNLTLVAATVLTGYLAEIEWRLPFIVYLLPAISLPLVHFIKSADSNSANKDATPSFVGLNSYHIDYKALLRLMLYYLLITFLVMAITINLPFLMSRYGFSSGESGDVISLFFLFIMLPGFFLNRLVSVIKVKLFEICLLFIGCGLLVIFFNSSLVGIVIGVLLVGFGYGVAQPCLYDRAATTATGTGITYALALLMVMNYVAIVISLPVIDFLQNLSGVKNERFAFALNFFISIAAFVFLLLRGTFFKKK